MRKLWLSLHHGGARRTLYWAAFGYLRCHRFHLLAMDLGPETTVAAVAPGLHYAVWDRDRVRDWRRGRADLPVEMYQDEIDGVDACAVALIADELAGFIWIYRDAQPSRLFHRGPRDAELNFGFVGRHHRGRGIFRSVLLVGAAWLAQQGYEAVYAGVHAGNEPSLRAFEHAGFHRIGTIRHVGPFRPKYPTPARPATR